MDCPEASGHLICPTGIGVPAVPVAIVIGVAMPEYSSLATYASFPSGVIAMAIGEITARRTPPSDVERANRLP